jgi:hypothetical protein
MEILIYYVIPNIVLFGSIFLISMGIERASWYIVCNYETIMKEFKQWKM